MANLSAGSVTIDFFGQNVGLTRTFAQVERQVNGFVARVSGSLNRIGSGFRFGGIAGLTAFTSALAGAFGASEKVAADFEQQMAKVSTLLVGPAMAWMPVYAQGLRDLSKEVGTSTADLSDSLFEIISAGVPLQNALGVLRASTLAARAGITTTAVATHGLTSILASYRVEAGKATEVTDKLFVAAQVGRLNFEGLAGNIGTVAPIARQAGLSLNELLAAFSALSQTLSADESATALRNFLRAFLKPQQQARDAAAQFGITLDATSLQGGHLVDTLQQLSKLSGPQLFAVFRDLRAATGVASLTSNIGFLQSTLDKLRTSGGATMEAFGKVAITTASRFQILKQTLLDVARAVGDAINTSIGDAIARMTESLKTIGQWVAAHTDAISAAAKFAGTLAAVGATMAAVIVAVKGLLSPLNAVAFVLTEVITRIIDTQVAGDTWAAKLGTVAVVIQGWVTQVSATFGGLLTTIQPIINGLASFIVSAFIAIRTNVLPAITGFARSVADAFAATVAFVTPILDSLQKTVVAVFTAIVQFLSPLAGTISATISAAFAVIQPIVVPILFALRDVVRQALFEITFAAQNWQSLMQSAFLAVQLGVVSFYEDARHLLGTNLPELLLFIGHNWTQIFTDIGNITLTVMKNVAVNVAAFFEALWKFVKSGFKDAFTIDFTPLTDGFKSVLTELPQFTERQSTATEKAISAAMDKLDSDLAKRKAALSKTFFEVPDVPVPPVVDELAKTVADLERLRLDVSVPPFQSQPQQIDTNALGAAVATATKASTVGLEEAFKRIQEAAATTRLQERQAAAAESTADNTAAALEPLNGILNAIVNLQPVPATFG